MAPSSPTLSMTATSLTKLSNDGHYYEVVRLTTPSGTAKMVMTTPSSQPPQHDVPVVKEHKSGALGCTFNLINTIIGAGIVGMPYALKNAGLVAGWFLILFSAAMTERSLLLLIATAKHVHAPSYERLAKAAFGVTGFRLVSANMLLNAYGSMLSYLILVKDAFSSLFNVDPSDTMSRQIVLLGVSLAIILPISSQRDMADLAWTSRLSVVIDIALVGIVAYCSPIQESLLEQDMSASNSSSSETASAWSGLWHLVQADVIRPKTIFVGLGVISFAFVCQHSAFMIAGSLERPTAARWNLVTSCALLFCALLASICGLSGYLGYLQETNANILNNLDSHSLLGRMGHSMLGFTMLFVYPTKSFVARHVCVVLMSNGRREHEGDDDKSMLNQAGRRIGLTFLLYVMAVIPAAQVEDLGSVLALTGAVGASCLSYVGPGVLYLGVHGERFLQLVHQSSWFSSRRRYEQASSNHNATEPMTKVGSRQRTSTSVVKDNACKSIVVESTPLMTRPEKTQDDAEEAESLQTDDDLRSSAVLSTEETMFVKYLQAIIWFATGMPIWCLIAASGQEGVQRHAHDMVLKSPYAIKIGDVEYQRVSAHLVDAKAPESRPQSSSAADYSDGAGGESVEDTDEVYDAEHGIRSFLAVVPNIYPFQPSQAYDNYPSQHDSKTTEASVLIHHQSGSSSSYQVSNTPHVMAAPNMLPASANQIIEPNIFLRKKLKQLNQDYQEGQLQNLESESLFEPPQWGDFVLAISYILFGLIAMLAGIFSLYYHS